MAEAERQSKAARQLEVAIGENKKTWQIAEERPVALVYNNRNYAVMLATPNDLDDFAVGFSISERIVNSPSEINSIVVQEVDLGFDIKVEIAPERAERLDVRQKRRNMVGSASCGLCGLENADSFLAQLPRVVETRFVVSDAVIARAVKELPDYQQLNAETYSVHGAAWVNLSGEVEMVREDIGRHNAVDKLLGARAKSSSHADGFLLVSSRCSYEIIEKAARHGVGAVVSISAPTGFAIDKAREANISLYCWSAEGAVSLSA